MVAPISTYGAYGISALSAFSQVAQTQKVDPIAAQEIKEASEVAKTARSLSDRVEPVRPNAKNDGTWAYVQSQNMGLPQVIDIEGMDTSDSKIVIEFISEVVHEFIQNYLLYFVEANENSKEGNKLVLGGK